MRARLARSSPAWLALAVLLALAPAIAVAQAEPEPSELRVSAPIEAATGDVVELHATLLAAGRPVRGAELTLYEQAAFLDLVERPVPVASTRTGDDGRAVIRYVVRRVGTRRLEVRFEGDARRAPVAVPIELPVVAGVPTFTVQPPAGIPGVNRFLLVAVVGGVWGSMLIVGIYVIAIAREPSGEGERRAS